MDRINKVRVDLGGLDELLNEFSKNVTIRVGIIGKKAHQKHEDSGLTNAELGAVHEFGATINVTPKMRAYLHHKGIHLKSDTLTTVIPTRSFLRMPLMSPEAKKEIVKEVIKNLPKDEALIEFLKTKKIKKPKNTKQEINNAWREEVKTHIPKDFMTDIAHLIADAAYQRVIKAFTNDGYGNWKPTTETSRLKRKNSADSPTLVDSGQLRDAITWKIIKK